MNIIFTPQRRDDALTASVSGETITLNGQVLDLSAATAEAPLQPEIDWIAAPVTRDAGGALQVTLLLPIGPMPSEAQCFPVSVIVTEGPVLLPQVAAEAEAQNAEPGVAEDSMND